MIRRAQNTFRSSTTGNGLNTFDSPSNINFSSWSLGQQLIDALQIAPQAQESWSIIGYAITAQLLMVGPSQNGVSFQAPFGKLGKIKAGIAIPIQPTQFYAGGSLASTGFQQLPDDPTLVSDLWDPDVNSLPPIQSGVLGGNTTPLLSSMLSVSTANNLPQPINLTNLSIPSYALTIGLWMLPSLFGCAVAGAVNGMSFSVWNAKYTVYYDDGEPNPRSGIPG